MFSCVVFFFFKQKTAYEVRISDWSSDVCSSDLTIDIDVDIAAAGQPFGEGGGDPRHAVGDLFDLPRDLVQRTEVGARHLDPDRALDPGSEHVEDRKSVV